MIGFVYFFEDIIRNFSSGIVGVDIETTIFDARRLGATHCLLVDVTKFQLAKYYSHQDSEIVLERRESLEEVEVAYPQATFVYLERAETLANANIPYSLLPNFTHPEDVIYVVGRDAGGGIVAGREAKTWVTIPVENLWARTAVCLCLYDRLVKSL